MTKYFVSGANGYLGEQICLDLHRRNINVIGLMRSYRESPRLTASGISSYSYESISQLMSENDIFIHCAGKVSDKGQWEDFEKINAVKRNAIQHYPMLVKKLGGYVYNDTVIEQQDPRRAVMQAKLQGCRVFDDSVERSMKPLTASDKVLLGDSKNWFINSNVHHLLEIFSLINTVDQCIIMCSSNSVDQLQSIVENLLGSGYKADDICVMFRFKNNKEWFEGNKYIKTTGVNKFTPHKKIFIINEKIPKPLLQNNIDPQLIISTLATQPSHYKTQAWLSNKPTVLYYCGSKPSGVENCADV